ncbi:MAG: hypothetical protein Q9174_002727 [Haloplaca sp. 1 TL-2023]
MVQYAKNALISSILKGNMCYIMCSTDPNFEQFPEDDKTRFFPEPGKHCKAKCWQNWKKGEELKLFGDDKLAKPDNEWGIQLEAFLKASYDNYKRNGFQVLPALPSPDNLFEDRVTSTSGAYLPVCDSKLINDVRRGEESEIPCMCGDEYGSETTQLWDAMEFETWDAMRLDDPETEDKRGPPFECRNDMAIQRVWPVKYYLNLCNMGWHWPTKQDQDDFDRSGDHLYKPEDQYCKEFREEVDAFAGDEKALNCHMCFVSLVGDKVQDQQLEDMKGEVKGPKRLTYNFERACKLLEDDHGDCPK